MNSRTFTNIALTVVALLLVAVLALRPSHAAGKLQYKYVYVGLAGGANVQDPLDKNSGDGWEFVSSIIADRNGQQHLGLIFKKSAE